MKWFKMNWLRSSNKKGQLTPEVAEATTEALDISLICKNLFIDVQNQVITAVFWDGSLLSRSNATQGLFEQVKTCKTKEEVIELLIERSVVQDKAYDTKEDAQLIADHLHILDRFPDFEINGSVVTLKGVRLAIPAPVLASFIEICSQLEDIPIETEYDDVNEEEEELHDAYQALKMFWLKLATNSLEQSREDLLRFVKINDVKITRNGNLVMYRRVISKGGPNKHLVEFIANQYYVVKRKGLDPRDFAIRQVGKDVELINLREEKIEDTSTLVGNLQHMYMDLPTLDDNSFTAYHDRKVKIQLGGIYKIPETAINLDNGLCAAGGLHAAAVDYNYSGFGDTPVIVLVNPSKAITVPIGETGKLRTTEMFVACVNPQPHGVHFDENALSVFDEEYHDLTLQELEEVAKKKDFGALSVESHVPSISLVDLDAIRKMLDNRVVDL